jgi:hypothetical protein
MGAKYDLSTQVKNTELGYVRTGCWEDYLQFGEVTSGRMERTA